MGAKKNYEDVKADLESMGWTLVSKEYPGGKLPIDVMCDKGHKLQIAYSVFSKYKSCKFCNKEIPRGPRPIITQEVVEQKFAERGWKVVGEYTSARKKIDVICNKGHETSVSWNNFSKGQGCKFCACNVKFDIQEARRIFEDNNCKLLDDVYVNNNTPMKFQCSCGAIGTSSVDRMKKKMGCTKCKGVKISKILSKDLPTPEMIDWFEKNPQIKLVDAKRVDGIVIIHYTCSCGENAKATWYNLKKCTNCWNCGIKKKSGDKCYMWNDDREAIELNKISQKKCYSIVRRILKRTNRVKKESKMRLLGYNAVDFKNQVLSHPLFNKNITYDVDHIFPVNLFIQKGITDIRIINHVNNLRPLHSTLNTIKGDRVVEGAFDVWIKDVEVHSEKIINEFIIDDIKKNCPKAIIMMPNNDKHYHENLFNEFKNRNEKVLFVKTGEWTSRKKQIISRYNMLNGANVKTIGGRNCECKTIEKRDFMFFCNEHHLQGSTRQAKFTLGLIYDNELVGGLSVSKHHRGSDEWVLDRLCFHSDIHVHGGTEKLLKSMIECCKKKGIKSVISFSDNCYSFGEVYEKNGFVMDGEVKTDYSYMLKTDYSQSFSKQSQRKTDSLCPEDLTESQWADMRGLVRIWDCGKIRWRLTIE